MPSLPYALLLLVASAVAQTEWNYDQCDASKGPSNWGGVCKGQANSGTPIDLCNAKAFPTAVPTITTTGYNVARELTVRNEGGKTLQVDIPAAGAPRLTAGGLSAMVGRGTNSSTHEWVLAQLHFHWGRTGRIDEGSEHYLQGKRYPIEVHYVHYNAQWGDLGAAVGSGKPEALLVVGVFFEQKNTDTTFMYDLGATVLRNPSSSSPVKLPSTYRMDELWSTSGAFYSYGGSLTTPGCNEQVTWIVMRDIKPITLDTLNDIKLATKSSSELISQYGNYRPIQPLGNRNLYFSLGATAQCDTVRSDPFFNCNPTPTPSPAQPVTPSNKPSNSGSLASPSTLSVLLALCATYFATAH